MTPEVIRFDARTGSEDVMRQLHRIAIASSALDHPREPPPGFDAFVGRVRNPAPGLGEQRRWIAVDGDRVVGFTTVYLVGEENRHLGLVSQLVVDPEVRRQGTGTLLLRAALADLRADGRTTVEAWGVVGGGPGEAWATGHGFRVTHAMQVQQLFLREADPVLWDVTVPPGYRLASWRERCPDELVESFTLARTAITDAPIGESSTRIPLWTVARVRELERELTDRGMELHAQVVLDDLTGAVVAFTLVEVHPHRGDAAYQSDTAVVAAHRGRGLGRCVKAAMTRTLVAELPELQRVMTHTATTNKYMIATNHAVGYTDMHTNVVLTHDVTELARSW